MHQRHTMTFVAGLLALAISCKAAPPSKPAAEDSVSLENLQIRAEQAFYTDCSVPPDGGTVADMLIVTSHCQRLVACGVDIATVGSACSPMLDTALCATQRSAARATCKLAGVQ